MKIDKDIQDYWDKRFREDNTGWDIGAPAPPLTAYIDQLKKKDLKILIPGCGYAWEGEHLHKKGFTEVYLLDVSPTAFENFLKRAPDFPKEHLIQEDFFDHDGSYDIILEQTFFCALHPSAREKYAQHMAQLLPAGGKLIGLLFQMEKPDGPPFGGYKEEYLGYFEPYFHIRKMEEAYNSIPPRQGMELFMILERKEEWWFSGTS